MVPLALPSLATLESDDDERLTNEFRFTRLREQAAVVRTLADHVERYASSTNADGLRAQLREETARLGYGLLETAAAVTRMPMPLESGIFVVTSRSAPDVCPRDSVEMCADGHDDETAKEGALPPGATTPPRGAHAVRHQR